MIKDYIEKIQSGSCSAAEITLMGICLILLGVVIGMLVAPARFIAAGSFNGNQGTLTKTGKSKKK
ncbi:MAG: hypothetical protein K6F35_03610 [Lachnospiraceae bacterium]|nr:hypothetical protein [Lachnospiraceae bacterium]